MNHYGEKTPMDGVEPTILGIALHKDGMNHHLNSSEGMSLAKSLIKGIPIDHQVIEWKKIVHCTLKDMIQIYWYKDIVKGL